MRSYHVIAIGVFLAVGFAIMVSIPAVRAQLRPTNTQSIQLHKDQSGITGFPVKEMDGSPN